jgi:hypothetical protein
MNINEKAKEMQERHIRELHINVSLHNGMYMASDAIQSIISFGKSENEAIGGLVKEYIANHHKVIITGIKAGLM